MARTPGAKSKKTLVAELQRLGHTGPFDELSCSQLRQEIEKLQQPGNPMPTPSAAKVVYVPDTTLIATAKAHEIIYRTRRNFDTLIDKYAPGHVTKRGAAIEVPEHVQDCLRRVFYAEDEKQAEKIAAKATERLYFWLLSEWGKKRITGPNTKANLQKRAHDALSWAERFEREGKTQAAEQQRQRAAEILTEKPIDN